MVGLLSHLPPFIFYDDLQACVVRHLVNQQPLLEDESCFPRRVVPAMQMCIQPFGIRIMGKIQKCYARVTTGGSRASFSSHMLFMKPTFAPLGRGVKSMVTGLRRFFFFSLSSSFFSDSLLLERSIQVSHHVVE